MKKWLGLALVGLLATACGPNNTGQLAFTLLGVPAGAVVTLEVVTPDGSIRSLSSTQTLTGLAAGNYTVRASDIERNGQNTLKAEVRYSKSSDDGKAKVEPTGVTTATIDYNVARLSVNISVSAPGGGVTAPTPSVRLLRGVDVIRTLSSTQTLLLAPGDYTLEAIPPAAGSSYEVALDRTAITLVAGDNLSANVVYSQGFGNFNLSITPPTGQTNLNPPAVLQSDNGSRFEVGSTRTLRLPVGRYTLSASSIELEQINFAPTLSGTTFDMTKEGNLSASVVYAATNSAVTVNVTGAGGSDTVTLRLIPATGQPTVRTQTGNGSQRFVVPLGTYTVDASAPRAGTYVDGVIGFRGSVTTTAPNFNQTIQAALIGSSFSGALLAVGNGGLNNRGWNTQFGDVPGLRRDTDAGVSLADSAIAAGATPNLFTALGTSLPAGRLRGEGLARVAFDASGNLYGLYQVISGGVSARVVRISRENLLRSTPELGETATGNKVITASGSVSGEFDFSDMAFDGSGNLWISNVGMVVTCISASQLSSSSTTITSASQQINLPPNTTDTTLTPNQRALRNYNSLYAIKFDQSGNLWLVSGDFRREGGAPNQLPRLSRVPAARLTCTSANNGEVTPDVRLSIALTNDPTSAATPASALQKPTAIALSPDGSTFWIADYGGGWDITGSGCPSGSNQSNHVRESIIKVPLNSANTTPNPSGELIRNAVVTARLTIGSSPDITTPAPEKGMQQPSDLAFDKSGRLWVATNNNVEVDSSNFCYTRTTADAPLNLPISAFVTDERGKLYSIAPAALADVPTSPDPDAPRRLSPIAASDFFTISSPGLGQGFTGIAFGK